jgi:protein-disulfide isomerase
METKNKTGINIPSAIIISAAIIAMAIIYVKKPVEKTQQNKGDSQEITINLASVNSTDNILGNENAPIKIVEYSDPSCPFCKVFNKTMHEIMAKYGASGKVAWVYRAFPLDTPDANGNILHPNARNESIAIECAGLVGGKKSFWEYQKKLYETTPSVTGQSPNGMDQKLIPIMAKELGIDTVNFAECMNSEKAKSIVNKQATSGINANVSGTPTSFFVMDKTINPTSLNFIKNALLQYRIPEDLLYVADDKKTIVMAGAMPNAMISGIIESLLKYQIQSD